MLSSCSGPYQPQMMYLSWTRPGKSRGPHLHIHQTDMFIFPGPGLFELYLWPKDKPHERKMISCGSDIPKLIMVWPGVVHAYKNVSQISGLVINLPDQLYKGYMKSREEDIIRFENDPNNPYTF